MIGLITPSGSESSNDSTVATVARVRHAPPDSQPHRLAVAAIALTVVWLLGWYWSTTVSIVAIWSRSPTFTHGYLILPIVLYLVWRDRARLAMIPVVPCFPALLLLGSVGFGWLLTELASVLGGKQFMLAAMIPVAVWAIAGTAMARALAFPLAYLFFAVPFGEFMVPALMDWTANFAIGALRMSGIPVVREGLNFSIPTGSWSVVEECSGINYLIASLAIGTLYTYLTYRSLLRRIVFVGLFVAIPLIANGIRAYLIVLIAYLTDNRLATGVDHIWLGWVLFGVVMLVMFWAAAHWREDDLAATAPSPDARVASSAPNSRLYAAVAATIVVGSMWRPVAFLIDAPSARPAVALPAVSPMGGWVPSGSPLVVWEPEFASSNATLSQVYDKGGDRVGLRVLFYRDQDDQRKLITSANQLVKSGNAQWRIATSGHADVKVADLEVRAKMTEFTNGTDRIVAWHWYRVAGRLTASDILAKAYLAFSRLAGRGDDSALVVIYTRKRDRSESEKQVLAEFAADMGNAIQRTLGEAEAH